jgi:hypothetical protein
MVPVRRGLKASVAEAVSPGCSNMAKLSLCIGTPSRLCNVAMDVLLSTNVNSPGAEFEQSLQLGRNL